jgi:hypothetical protein
MFPSLLLKQSDFSENAAGIEKLTPPVSSSGASHMASDKGPPVTELSRSAVLYVDVECSSREPAKRGERALLGGLAVLSFPEWPEGLWAREGVMENADDNLLP